MEVRCDEGVKGASAPSVRCRSIPWRAFSEPRALIKGRSRAVDRTSRAGGIWGLLGITVTRPSLTFSRPCDSLSMTRVACAVVPGLPHHVTQRGKGLQ